MRPGAQLAPNPDLKRQAFSSPLRKILPPGDLALASGNKIEALRFAQARPHRDHRPKPPHDFAGNVAERAQYRLADSLRASADVS